MFMLIGIFMAHVVYTMFDSAFNSSAAEVVETQVQDEVELPRHPIGQIPQD